MNDNDHDGREAQSHNEKFPPWWVFADDVDDDEGDDDDDGDDDEGDELVLGKLCGFVRPDY